MCTHSRFVFNPYSRRNVLVKCGKCPACQQEKAFKRATLIRNNMQDGMIALFFTLTYSNDFVPYINRADILSNVSGDINIYRNSSIRQIYDRHSNKLRWKKIDETVVLGSVMIEDLDLTNMDKIPNPKGLPKNFVSVCWFPDIQDFYKRLRNYLQRKLGYEKRFSYFTCSEYGGYSKRAHAHGLLFINREDEAMFRSAIVQAWPFADFTRTAKFIEVARDAANYVASYVNSPASLFPLLQAHCFKQKHSHSKNFGCLLDCFSLRSILQKIDKGDLFYYIRQKFDGTSNVRKLPIPLYILYRYFPICKGFGWLDSCQLRTILLDPKRVGEILGDYDVVCNFNRDIYDFDSFSRSFVCGLNISHRIVFHRQTKLINPLYTFTPKETYCIYVRLENCFKRFHAETGLSRYDYAFYYERVYSLYNSLMHKLLHEDINDIDEYLDFYDNGFEVLDNPLLSPTLSNLNLCADPNKRKFIVACTDRNNSLFYRMNKQKDVTNYCLSNIGYNV